MRNAVCLQIMKWLHQMIAKGYFNTFIYFPIHSWKYKETRDQHQISFFVSLNKFLYWSVHWYTCVMSTLYLQGLSPIPPVLRGWTLQQLLRTGSPGQRIRLRKSRRIVQQIVEAIPAIPVLIASSAWRTNKQRVRNDGSVNEKLWISSFSINLEPTTNYYHWPKQKQNKTLLTELIYF